MTKQAEGSHTESEMSGETDLSQYNKRFEEAVADAQHLLIYASSKCPQDINRGTAQKLIDARISLEKGRKLSAEEEVAFWLAYQEIWKLVQPASAESIRANRPMEGSTTSKARRTVNKYVGFALAVLLLLLVLQIYWVIGNQLTSKLESLLTTETALNAQVDANTRAYKTIEILYKQKEITTDSYKLTGIFTFYKTPEWDRDTLDIVSERTRLDAELASLKTQIDRSSTILLIWSGPWKSRFLDEKPSAGKPAHSDTYAAQFDDLQKQLDSVESKLDTDSTGEKEAQRLNDEITPQLESLVAQYYDLYLRIDELNKSEQDVQARINEVSSQSSDLEKLNDAAARDKLIQGVNGKLGELNAALGDLEVKKTVIQNQQKDISTQLTTPSTDPSQDPSQEVSRTSALVDQLNSLDAQLKELQDQENAAQAQIDELNNQLSAISGDSALLEQRKRDLDAQKADLKSQLEAIQRSKSNNNDQIQSLQVQRNALVARLISPEDIVVQWKQEREEIKSKRAALERQEKTDVKRESSRQAQLAGQFVLVILQGYLLPLFYGILGASTSVLRSLSRQIETVTFSEEAGIQHGLRISLGALAGIMVGWFSFLINTTTFLGSVSPLAIAFLVGYNIELFFSFMDVAINRFKAPQKDSAKDSGDKIPPPQNVQPKKDSDTEKPTK